MVGIGETDEELTQVFHDLAEIKVDILTLGQYLQPTKQHLPIARWVHPDQFAEFKRHCLEELKFPVVESGPLVRSSYHAEEQAELKYLQAKGVRQTI
jgi:lipoic acid synthetase